MVAGNTAYCPKGQGAPEPKYSETKTQRPSELLSLRTPESMTHYGNKLLGGPTWWPYGDLWSKDTSVLLVAIYTMAGIPGNSGWKACMSRIGFVPRAILPGRRGGSSFIFSPPSYRSSSNNWTSLRSLDPHVSPIRGTKLDYETKLRNIYYENNICLVLCSFQGSWGHTVWKWGQTFLYVSAFCGVQRHKAGFENLRGLQGPSR